MRISTIVAFAGCGALSLVYAGPLAYGPCQTECNKVAETCYSAAGLTFGTVVADADAPVEALTCNAALGNCSTACAKVALPSSTS